MRLLSLLQREDNPGLRLLWTGYVSMFQSQICLPDLLQVMSNPLGLPPRQSLHLQRKPTASSLSRSALWRVGLDKDGMCRDCASP